MSAIVRETSEYVEMSDSITLCIVKDGAAGTSHGVTLTMEKRTISSVEDDCLVVTFTKGDTDGVTTTNNVQDMGGYAQLYVDGKIDTSATARLNLGTSEAGELQKGAFPQVFTAGYVTVKWYDKEGGTLLGMGSLTRGADGKDATVYGVQVSSYSEWISSGNKQQGLQFGFTKTTGTTVEKYTDVTKMGCTVKIYGDDTLYDNVSGWINEGNDNFLFSSFPYNNVVGNPTLADKSVISVELYHDDVLLATANYANGKQGALEISVDPDTLVFDTDDDGIVPSGTSKRATIACYRDGKKVTNVEYDLMEGGHPDCDASISTSNSTATVTISNIAKDESYGVSKTCGTVEVQVYDKDNGRNYFPVVKFSVNVAKFNGGLKADNKRLESEYTKLKGDVDNKFTAYDSKLEQTSERISSAVSKVDEVGKTVSEIKQTSNGISSTVSVIRYNQIGNNYFTGVTGIGWHGGVFDGAGGFCIPYTDYAFLPPIPNFTGDYILSFGNYNGNLQIEIYQTYDAYEIDKLNYYCNFNGDKEIPILLVVEGNNNDTLNNTYLVTSPNANLASLKKDDIVVVQKHVTSTKKDVYPKCKIKTIISDTTDSFQASKVEHRYLYKVTVSEIAGTDDNAKTYNSYGTVSLVCSVSTNDTVVDGTALNTVNFDNNISRSWIRFKGDGNTWLIRVKAIGTNTDIYFGSIMVEDATLMGEDIRPHRFSFESSALSSSIKQTATEIRQEVGDSYTSLKNGNFTIGANTKIIGNLNVTGTSNKISITNDDGTQITQIQPVSIGTWDNIKNRSTIELHLYRTQSASFATDNYGKLDSAQSVDGNNYVFTNYFDVGTFNTGDSIQMNTSYGERVFDNGSTSHQNADSKYDLYKVVNGTVTTLMTWNNIASKNYILTETALLRVKVTTTVALGSLNTFKPNSIVTLSWKVGLDAVVPDKGQLITTVGYDGIASSYGNGNYMMIGKDIAAFKYGNYEIQLSKDGIIGLSTKKVFRMFANASGMIYDNTLGAWKFVCGTNTIYNTFIGLNTRTPTYLYLPSSPYDGQEITVIDKCFGVNFYVVPTGGYKMCFDGATSNSYYNDKHELPQNTMWHFIFIYDTWYAE